MNKSMAISTYGTIVIVDNDVLMRDFITSVLENQFQVAAIRTAEQALDLIAAEGPFDIVISSFALADMNGLDFLQVVSERFPLTIRILISGGCGDKIDINQAISKGHINCFIAKPFSITTLRDLLINDLASIRTLAA